ncbi:MAG TPA: hypothetical protein VFY29_01180 [Terriglobia bacterium]|nr:hypothetical protein [Terriglobia bacterium]
MRRAWMIVMMTVTLIAMISCARNRDPHNESAAVANLRVINTAEVTFLSNEGEYGTIPELINAGLLDSRFHSIVAGYRFEILLAGKEYVATATPTAPNFGRFEYYSSPDGVVRYSTAATWAPPGQAGRPVQ